MNPRIEREEALLKDSSPHESQAFDASRERIDALPSPLQGLSREEAEKRLTQYGPNAVAEEKTHPVQRFLEKFWAPVPWMLETIVVLELILKNDARPSSAVSVP
jgi:magnesium-transporting ATPase (P-type)